MSELAEHVQSTILEQGLLPRGETVLVGVSGGVDSMVLLHVLHGLPRDHAWPLVVAHFNHQLRGAGGDADEVFVRRAARKLRVRYQVGTADVRRFAKDHKLSIEMAGRQLRHEFLARTALASGSRTVALGHHADDQIELFFLRLLRGAGLEGLSGMKAKAPSPAVPSVTLVRPLLRFSRADIESFAREKGIEFRDDPSNADGSYQRNRIRHELLPLLRAQFQPSLDTVIPRLMEIIAAESEFVAARTERAYMGKEGSFLGMHRAVQRRWIRTECLRLGIDADFELVETLRCKPGTEVMISPETVVALDETGQLHVRPVQPPSFQSGEKTVLLSAVGATEFDGAAIIWAIKPRRAGASCTPAPAAGRESFDADKIGSTVLLRHWRAGDRFQPIGMRTPVKLQNLFVNQKISRSDRSALVVAETATGQIFWVEGLRMSESFKLNPSTRHCLEWRWERTEARP